MTNQTTTRTRIQTRANRANKVLSNLPNYHICIPLGDIFTACLNQGLVPLQEDCTPWEGLLAGTEGRVAILLGKERVQEYGIYDPWNRVLVISWYKMPKTGNYEIVAYVS